MSVDITHRAAVLGSPIEHSLSPILHNAGYQALGLKHWDYSRIEVSEQTLPDIVAAADSSYRGFSVTMPGKFAALEYAEQVSERARLIGSANTLVRTERGWRADNTDCDGITGALGELLGPKLNGLKRALVIGGGGTARPALWALAQAGVEEITVLNRSDRSAQLAPLLAPTGTASTFLSFDAEPEELSAAALAAEVIVSTVPAAAIADLAAVLGRGPVLDVIYDPWPTPLTVAAAANGYATVGGHVMLAHQAYGQFEQFTGHPAPREAMRAALSEALKEKVR